MRISDWSSDVCSSDLSAGGMHELLRRCALAVLTTGSTTDDPRAARELYPDFDIQVHQLDRGLRLDLFNAPAIAFVDGQIIRGVAELLAAVVRDLVYTAIELGPDCDGELESSAARSEEHTSELQSLMRISYAVFCLKQKIEQI